MMPAQRQRKKLLRAKIFLEKNRLENLGPRISRFIAISSRCQTFFTVVTKTLLEQCCGACWSMRETPPVNFSVFYETEPEDAGLSFPYIVSAVDRQLYGEHYIPIIKDPSSAFVQKKEGLIYICTLYTAKSSQVPTSVLASYDKLVTKKAI